MRTNSARKAQQTLEERELGRVPDYKALAAYAPNQFTLIPLHRPDATSTKKNKKTGKPIKGKDGKPVVYKDGKRPLHFNWTKQKYETKKTIRECEERGLNAGVRLRANQVVIDIDPRNKGDEGFDALCIDLGLDTDKWPCVITGSGGRHYYLTKPSDVLVVDTLKDYPGVEFKSKGRQVVAAGSVHPDTGEFYKFDDKQPGLDSPCSIPDAFLRIITRPQRSTSFGGGQYDQETIAKLLTALDVFTFNHNEAEWRKVMMACHDASNGDARHEFLEWCAGDPEYADELEAIGRRWDSLHADSNKERITYKTLNHFVVEAGHANLIPPKFVDEDEFPDDDDKAFEGEDDFEGEEEDDSWQKEFTRTHDGFVKAKDPHNLRVAYRALGITLRYDAFQHRAFVEGLEECGPVLTDSVLRRLRFLVKDKFGFLPDKDLIHEFTLHEAQLNSFHPVKDYFASLKWDGVPRLDSWLIDYAGAEDTEYVRAVSALPLIAAVRRIHQPGAKYDEMLVLESPQGKDKSSALEIMAINKDWFTDSFPLNADPKRTIECLVGKLICECAELHGMKKTEIDQVKATLSRNTDRARMAYGRMPVEEPRQSVFIGTANERNYLKDPTGNRRFWPVGVKHFDLVRLKKDRDQIWAEAVAREAAGESIRLDKSLWGAAAKEQRKRSDIGTDPYVNAFRSVLGDMEGKISSEDAWRSLGLPIAGHRTLEQSRRFGASLRFLNWKATTVRIAKKSVQGFVKGDAHKRKRIVVTRFPDGDIVARYEDEDEA